MSEQTAVEWLIQKLTNRQNGVFDGLPHLSVDEIYNQAKEMEKQQMRECYENVFFTDSGSELKFEQYYNETYGGNK